MRRQLQTFGEFARIFPGSWFIGLLPDVTTGAVYFQLEPYEIMASRFQMEVWKLMFVMSLEFHMIIPLVSECEKSLYSHVLIVVHLVLKIAGEAVTTIQ